MLQPSRQAESDRNLLFGILALQLNFINQDDLVAGMSSWVLNKQRSLGEVLLEQSRLSEEQAHALETLLVQHLKVHENKPERSLQALDGRATVSALMVIQDEDVQATVTRISGTGEAATSTFIPTPGAGRYPPIRWHASGGVGDVYVAEDVEIQREVALKELKAKYANDVHCRRRFVSEAKITGGLTHPGIVPVYGLGAYSDGRPFYAMRFIRGESLKEAIANFHAADKQGRDPRERSLALRQLLRRFIDACNAVAYAHSRGVLHRDLKPGNIMLGGFGETLVVDWGIAKAGVTAGLAPPSLEIEAPLTIPVGDDAHETRPGGIIGTVAYMSPEQASGRIDLLTPASDIFSLGATLYDLLTGQVPYKAENDPERMKLAQRGQFPPPIEVKANTPRPLDAICRKAMAFERNDRYPTALELAADVEHWLADEPVSAYPDPFLALKQARFSGIRSNSF